MNPSLLTENGWKAVLLKFKLKDNGFQRALAAYEHLGADQRPERLKAVASVRLLAANLQKIKEIAALPAVVKYLADVKLEADRQAKVLAMTQEITTTKAKTASVAFKKLNDYVRS